MKHRHTEDYDVFYHLINPAIPCRIVLSFGFYRRNDHHRKNPYGLLPFPSTSLYSGPYNLWTFGVNLRVKCQQDASLCGQNISLARDVHSVWNASHVWKTHPHYVNGPSDQGVDFIAEPTIRNIYLTGSHSNPILKKIGPWLIKGFGEYMPGIEIKESSAFPDDSLDLWQWILDRITEVNELGPLQTYMKEHGLGQNRLIL
jgi:hypothetical protein